jgi:hypothetical protein
MPKGAFLCVSVGTGFELVRLIPGENMPPGEHRISPSNSARSFHFGPKTQIAAHHPVYREGRRIPDFKNSSLNFQIEKIIGTRSFGFAQDDKLPLSPSSLLEARKPKYFRF